MFNNISRKCKALAKVIFWFGLIGSLAGGITLIVMGGSYYYQQTTYYVSAAVTIIFGPLISWITAIPVYAIGEAVENSAIAANFSIKADQERQQEQNNAGHIYDEMKRMQMKVDPQKNAEVIAEYLKEELKDALPDQQKTAEVITEFLRKELLDSLTSTDQEGPAADTKTIGQKKEVLNDRQTADKKLQIFEKELPTISLAGGYEYQDTQIEQTVSEYVEQPAQTIEKTVMPKTETTFANSKEEQPVVFSAVGSNYQLSQSKPAVTEYTPLPTQTAVSPMIPVAETVSIPQYDAGTSIRNGIKCPECGKMISSKAPVCPNCGTPIAGKKILVHFERKKAFSGSANTGSVIIDGLTVGSAANGASFDVMLTAGTHNVVIESKTQGMLATDRSYSKMLEIPDDAKRVNVTIVVKTDTSSFLSGGMAIRIGDVQVIR